jgi:DNA-binding CsgD family transcriptional regulator
VASDDQLVGRGRELAALDAVLGSLAAGSGGALLFEAHGGLGKSCLVREAIGRGRAAGLQVLTARAVAPEQDFPYGVAVQLFERGLPAPGTPAWVAHFAGAPSVVEPLFTGEPAAGQERTPYAMLHGLFWLAVNLAHERPTLLCVDDAHLADEGSLRFLSHLARRLEEVPIALVAAARPAVPREDAALTELRGELAPQRHVLAPLPVSDVGEIVRHRIPHADERLVGICADVTRGNPFYVHEMLRALAAEPPAGAAELGDRLREVGFATLSRAALLRLGRLGADAIALARALAVLGDGTQLRHAAHLAELDYARAARAADLLAAEQILAAEDPLAFAHPLIGQAIEAELPVRQRGQAQLRAARLLDRDGAAPALVAAHLLLAPAAGDPWVVEVLRASARQAQLQGLPAVAARELDRALVEPPPQALRAQVLLELGTAELAAARESAVKHLEEAAQLMHGVDRVVAQRRLARALAARGDRIAASSVLEQALDDPATADRALHEGLLGDYLVNAVFEPGIRQRAFVRTAHLKKSVPQGDTPAERAVLAALALRSAQDAEHAAHSLALARRAWRDGALLAEQGVEGPGWTMVVGALHLCDELGLAARVAARVLDDARRAGSVDAFARASYARAMIHFDQGLLAEAEADLEQVRLAARDGISRYAVNAEALRAMALVARNDVAGAAALLATQPETTGMERAWLLFARGWVQLALNRAPEALLLFLRTGSWISDELAAEHTVLPWRAAAGRAALAVGDLARARKLAEPLVELGERAGLPLVRGRGLRLLGLLDDEPAGIGLLHTAAELYEAAGARLEHAATLVDLGAKLRRSGERVQARRPLRDGLDRAVRLGAHRLADRARAELAAAGGRPRREASSGPAALTPSELRVVRLAADGLSNAQIAQSLFVTPKTVEFHLSNAYQKLGITNRAGLAAALAPE